MAQPRAADAASNCNPQPNELGSWVLGPFCMRRVRRLQRLRFRMIWWLCREVKVDMESHPFILRFTHHLFINVLPLCRGSGFACFVANVAASTCNPQPNGLGSWVLGPFCMRRVRRLQRLRFRMIWWLCREVKVDMESHPFILRFTHHLFINVLPLCRGSGFACFVANVAASTCNPQPNGLGSWVLGPFCMRRVRRLQRLRFRMIWWLCREVKVRHGESSLHS